MMKSWISGGVSLALLAGLASGARAQVVAPPAPVAAVPVAPVAPVAATAAAPRNLWSFLCLTPEQKAACKASFCNSQLGQLLNNGLKPASAFTGGVVPSCCPPVTAAELTLPPDSAQGAAAKIKQDEAEAKARRAAVRYLGTVDCNYWPEARDALINSLRADRNECVRLEAALALGRGCCCTKDTIKALTLTVSGSNADGNPTETSERVKWAAVGALEHCLACYVEVQPVPPPPPPPPGKTPDPREPTPPLSKAGGQGRTTTSYYLRLDQVPMKQVVAEARQVLQAAAVSVPGPAMATSAGRQGLVALVRGVMADRPATRDVEPPPAGRVVVISSPTQQAPGQGSAVMPASAASPARERPSRSGLLPALWEAVSGRR